MMFKSLFFILMMLLSNLALAKVEMRWLSAATIVLEDGKTKILFDPAFTRPSLKHWLGFSEFRSDRELVASVLKKNRLTNIDAVFASHSHFDHVIDAPMVSSITGAVFYVDGDSWEIADAYDDKWITTYRMRNEKPLFIGDFTVIPIQTEHSKLFSLFSFLPGNVPSDFNFGFWDYHVGTTWMYVVTHKEGIILIDQGPDADIGKVRKHTIKVHAIVQGVASRKGNEEFIKGYATEFKPQVFVPNHFDNFLKDFDPYEESLLPGVGLDGLLDEMKKALPATKVIRPKFGQKIVLLEIN